MYDFVGCFQEIAFPLQSCELLCLLEPLGGEMSAHGLSQIARSGEKVSISDAWTLLENAINGSPYVRADRDKSLPASLVRVLRLGHSLMCLYSRNTKLVGITTSSPSF